MYITDAGRIMGRCATRDGQFPTPCLGPRRQDPSTTRCGSSGPTCR